jgi:competence protein ComEC
MLNKASVLVVCLTTAAAVIFILVVNSTRRTPRVVFCDVGQGDAIYIRTPEQKDVLVDFGPSGKINTCLNHNLPFFDRQVELAFISHLQKDHAQGLTYVLTGFQIKELFLPKTTVAENPRLEAEIKKQARLHHIKLSYVSQNDELTSGKSTFKIVWPSASLAKGLDLSLNENALGIWATIDNKQIGLFSDLGFQNAEKIVEHEKTKLDVLKINHHGSRYATSRKFLELADPGVAVISVGKDNWYQHPHKEVLELLKSLKIPFHRTDVEGSVTIEL